MITKETTKRAAKILAEQKREYERKFQRAKGDSKAIASAAAEYRSEYGKTPLKRWHNALSQAAKETASHSAPVRKPAKPATKTAAAPKASKPVTKKAPAIKPLGGFTLTKTGELCKDQKAVSDWGSENIATWRRLYSVYIYADKKATICGMYLIRLKNGQYYIGNENSEGARPVFPNSERRDAFIHPQGDKKPAKHYHYPGSSLPDCDLYYFRDINEAFYFAEFTCKCKINDRTNMTSKTFHEALKDAYWDEYNYARHPSRRGTSASVWDWNEKPQPVQTKIKK